MRSKNGIIAAFWFFQAANFTDRVAITFAAPLIMSTLHLGPAQFGIVLSAFGIGYTIAHIPGGILADRWSAKGLLVITPVLWALFSGMTGLVASVAGFAIARALLGAAEGLSNAAPFRVYGEYFPPKERAMAMALSGTGRSLGVAIIGPLAGIILAAFGWRSLFFAMVVPSLISAALCVWLLPGHGEALPSKTSAPVPEESLAAATEPEDHTPYFGIFKMPSLWVLTFIYVFFNIVYWGYTGWMPTFLAKAHHLDIKHTAFYGSIPYVGTFVGSILLGGGLGMVLHKRRPEFLAVSFLLGAASLYLSFAAHSLTGALLGLSSAAVFINGTAPIFGALMIEAAPARARAFYIGVVMTAGQIGGVVAPALIGALAEKSGNFGSGFALMEISMVIAAIGMMVMPFVSRAAAPAAVLKPAS